MENNQVKLKVLEFANKVSNKKLKEEVKYLQSELDDYEQFSETIASARP